MRINTNIASLTAQRNLANTTRAFARALERLSSGKRINRAGDDAAGLAISERLKSQVGGMNRAALNVNEAFGFLNTADGALATQIDLVQRMRELALQAANGTLSTADRSYLDDEFQTLLAEFDRIAEQSEFNGVNLLDGSMATLAIQVGTAKGESIEIGTPDTRSDSVFEQLQVERGFSLSNSSLAVQAFNYSAVAGDVNGDGSEDLLFNAAGSSNVNLYLNNGNGTFASMTTLTGITPGGSIGMDLVDVNDDGMLDLISNASAANYLSVALGNGNGSFAAVTTYAIGTPGAVVVRIISGDVDNDGNVDLITRDATDSTFSILLGNGDGTFDPRTTILASGGLAVDDVNSDGMDDLVSHSGGVLSIRLASGGGSFSAAITQAIYNNFGAIQLGDVNNDQNLDVVLSGDFMTVVHLGNGTGSFSGPTTHNTATNINTAMQLVDLDADGNLDIVGTASGGQIGYQYGDGNGSFGTMTSVTIGAGGWRVLDSADLNGDGYLEVIVPNGTGTIGAVYSQSTSMTSATHLLDITNQESAQDVLSILDSGLEALLEARSQLGSQHNRLEFAASNTSVMAENLSAARSQIIDADIAEETAELTRAQILQQAGVSVLGQANTAMQMVLGLLRF